MGETTYYQRNGERILNRSKDYYEKNKKALREKAKIKHKELSEEKKEILKEYQNNYHEANKTKKLSFFCKTLY